MLVRKRTPCNFCHNGAVRTPSIIICRFPHFCFNFSIIHNHIRPTKQQGTRKVHYVKIQYGPIISKFNNPFHTLKAYTLSCNSRIRHIMNSCIFVFTSKNSTHLSDRDDEGGFATLLPSQAQDGVLRETGTQNLGWRRWFPVFQIRSLVTHSYPIEKETKRRVNNFLSFHLALRQPKKKGKILCQKRMRSKTITKKIVILAYCYVRSLMGSWLRSKYRCCFKLIYKNVFHRTRLSWSTSRICE